MAKRRVKTKPDHSGLKQVHGMLVGAVVLLIGLGLLLASGQTSKSSWENAGKNPLEQVVTADPTHPSEDSIDPDANYYVANDMPRRIIIESQGVKGFIQQVGLNPKNAVTVPSNINFAGWYNGSVKPGEAGLSIIDGHVSGVHSDGIFKQLGQLKPGTTFVIEYGDRSTRSFEVVEVKSMPEAQSSKYLFNKWGTIPRQLNLITCGGKFDKTAQTYSDRVIVISKHIN